MRTIAFFLEEPSAKAMLEGLLPRILPPDVNHNCIVFRGKQHLEKNLTRRLKNWDLPRSVFVVMRDQNSGDCYAVKQRLTELCQEVDKESVLVRVACRELETFYLGDLEAVEKGLGLTGLASQQGRRKFRNPDALGNPYQELRRLTQDRYQKGEGSRSIAPHLRLEGNTSNSFNVLLAGIRTLLGV